MRIDLQINSQLSLGFLRARGFALLALLVATLCGALMLRAQAPATAVSSFPAHKPAHQHKRPVAVLVQTSTTQVTVAPTTPPAPEIPKWPANEKPSPASVTWDSQGLRIDAANSSLAQILSDVSTVTGATVEGFDADQRVFGVFGPGPARDVLSQLLQGSGYNVILIGDQGQGTPREILLSLRHAGTKTTAAVNPNPAPISEEDSDTDEQPQPGQPPNRSGFVPGRPPLTPQQMQQQRAQPVQPPSNPQN
ncbi:MAG: hypothetical protein ACLPXT_04195 [Terracidiphilus sp.]